MNTITCNKCGNIIEVTDALEEQARISIEKKLREESKKEIEHIQKDAEENAGKRLKEHFEFETKQRQSEMEEMRKYSKNLQEQLLTLTKKLQEEKSKSQDLEIKMRKELLEAQDKIFTQAKTKADEEHKLTISELTKQIQDFKKANEELNKKLDQRSQQLQGEVQELDLESTLRSSFPFDGIEPIGKGVKGADVRQIVRTQIGNVCGVILWESKQTKTWSNEWLGKLKNDLRAEKANIPIIISTQLPEEAQSGFGMKDGVVIVGPAFIIPIAEMIRQRLIDIARERYVLANRGGKAEDLYTYITSHEFRQQIEVLKETFDDMQHQIIRERVAYEKSWKTREAQITKLFSSTARMLGSMRGIIGQSLPSVKGFELEGEHNENGTMEDV